MEFFVSSSLAVLGAAYYFEAGPVAAILGWLGIYLFLSTVVPLARNAAAAKRVGIPSVFIPWNPHSLLWMVLQHPLGPILKRNLPTWLWKRLYLTTFGWEFACRLQPFEEYAAAQGDPKTFALTSCSPVTEVYTWDAELIAQVLNRPRDFNIQDLTAVVINKFGKSLFTSTDEAWTRQRKLVASVINDKISSAVFYESIRQAEGLLEEVISSTTPDSSAVDTNKMFDMMKKITFNVLSNVGMGVSVSWNEKDINKPRPGYEMNYFTASKMVCSAIAGPVLLPIWLLSNYPSSLPGAAYLHQLSHAMREFPAHTRAMLDEERQRSAASPHQETRGNIMSQLLRASEQDPDSKGPVLSEDELAGNLFVFTVAGFDTTANTLSYSLMMLSRYPAWQEWLIEEVDQLVAGKSMQDLQFNEVHPNATRIMAFMLETLRHFPPLVHMVKQARGDQTIQTSRGTVLIPADCNLYLNSVAAHYNPAVFRNLNLASDEKLPPSDDDEFRFRPSRWINPSSAATKLFQPPKGTYIPWSMGPRHCPGMKMAQVEFVSVMVTLLRQCRIGATPLEGESRVDVQGRIDAQVRNSMSTVTLAMKDVYDMKDEKSGFKLRLSRRA